MADTISNMLCAGPSVSSSVCVSSDSSMSQSTSGSATSFLHPTVEHPMEASAHVDPPDDMPDIITFDLESCDEVPETEFNNFKNIEHNKENKEDVSDKDMANYMQLFEKHITKGGMFQGCTVNITNPVFNITIQK